MESLATISWAPSLPAKSSMMLQVVADVFVGTAHLRSQPATTPSKLAPP